MVILNDNSLWFDLRDIYIGSHGWRHDLLAWNHIHHALMSNLYLGCPSPLRGWLMLGACPMVWMGTAPIRVIGIVFPGPLGPPSLLRLWFTGGASAVIDIMFSPRRIISPSTRFISFSGSPINSL